MFSMNDRLTDNDYVQLREFLSREFGLFFEPSKLTFLENRILPFLKKKNFLDVNQLIAGIQNNSDNRAELIDALTTNETWFFRHPRHFDILREDILPGIIKERTKQNRREISVWSAGCSIGAEAYSIAITLAENLPEPATWKIRIIGSDISRQAVHRALEGVYTQTEVRLISKILLNKYFIPCSNSVFKIKTVFLPWIHFEEMNLLEPWPPDRTFDIIFCRNTMIYFKEETKTSLTERFYRVLNPEGVFFTSATEILHWVGSNEFHRFFVRGEYIYRKKIASREYILYRFSTPADLLRALNLLVKENYEYYLQAVQPLHSSGPKKAITIPKSNGKKVDRLFGEAALKTESREEISQ